jgi:hypothetical protein
MRCKSCFKNFVNATGQGLLERKTNSFFFVVLFFFFFFLSLLLAEQKDRIGYGIALGSWLLGKKARDPD